MGFRVYPKPLNPETQTDRRVQGFEPEQFLRSLFRRVGVDQNYEVSVLAPKVSRVTPGPFTL